MLYTNKFIIILKWRKCNHFFKQLIKGNVKYVKHFFTFRCFILFWENIFWHSIEEKYFMIWYSLEHTTRSPRFFKYCLEVSMNTNQWERLSWKTVYSMIVANNNTSEFVVSYLDVGGPLGRGHLQQLVFITDLLLVLPVGYMDPLLSWPSTLYCV